MAAPVALAALAALAALTVAASVAAPASSAEAAAMGVTKQRLPPSRSCVASGCPRLGFGVGLTSLKRVSQTCLGPSASPGFEPCVAYRWRQAQRVRPWQHHGAYDGRGERRRARARRRELGGAAGRLEVAGELLRRRREGHLVVPLEVWADTVREELRRPEHALHVALGVTPPPQTVPLRRLALLLLLFLLVLP